MFHGEIQTAHPEAVARGINLAIGDYEIAVVISGKSIVTGAKIAIGHRKIVAKTGVQAIMTASNKDPVNFRR
jgi:hypothetical protein